MALGKGEVLLEQTKQCLLEFAGAHGMKGKLRSEMKLRFNIIERSVEKRFKRRTNTNSGAAH